MLSVYPSITVAEFSLACEALEQRCHDRLGGTRWLSVKWTGDELRIRQNGSIAATKSSPVAVESHTGDSCAEIQSADLAIEEDDTEAVSFLPQHDGPL